MNYTYLHYQTGLSVLHGIGPKRAREFIQLLGSVEPLYTFPVKQLSEISGFRPEFFRKIKREEALKVAENAVDFHTRKNIESIFFTDERFPRRLSNCIDAPTMLFYKGNIDLNAHRYVAIVGTRSATEYGREICKRLIQSFSGKNIVVVSGLAYGIDSYAHRYCLEYNVPTIAILGHGLDRIYPSGNRELASRIPENGALITEFVPFTNPDRENFPRRNRIVAGMCDATIVVESKNSGGSLITADLANGYNKDVFAFPGNINTETSQGCNSLISEQKAHLIQSPEDFLNFMNWNDPVKKENIQLNCFPELSGLQQEIAALVGERPEVHLDVIATSLSIPISTLNTELIELQINGILKELPGKRYKHQ